MGNDIFNQVINDLKIKRYGSESENDFYARVVYSAISFWIRVNLLSSEVSTSNYNPKVGISKMKNTLDMKKILEAYFEIRPYIRNWYNDRTTEEIVNIVRNRLEAVGEILSIGNRVILPDKKSSIYVNKFNRSSILNEEFGSGYLSGLTWFHNLDMFDGLIFENYINDSPSRFASKMINNAALEYSHSEFSYEVFLPKASRAFHNSWIDSEHIKDHNVHLGRKKNNLGFDFFLVQKVNDKPQIQMLEDLYKSDFEIRRILYGIAEMNGIRDTVKIDLNTRRNIAVLKLSNGLPDYEREIIEAIAWPQRHLEDTYNYVFNLNVLPLIERVLTRLNIDIRKGEFLE